MKYVVTTTSPKMTYKEMVALGKKKKINPSTIYKALKDETVASPRVAKAILGREYEPNQGVDKSQ